MSVLFFFSIIITEKLYIHHTHIFFISQFCWHNPREKKRFNRHHNDRHMDGKLVLIDFMLFILHLFFTVIILFILTNLIHHQIAMSWEKNKMRKWHLRKLMWIKLVHHCHIVSIFVVWFAGSFFFGRILRCFFG